MMKTVSSDKHEFAVTIERSPRRRKTFSILVNREKGVIIKVPYRAKDKEIEAIVKKHETWIQEKIEHVKNQPPKPKRQFAHGETLLFLGNDYTIKVHQSPKFTHAHCHITHNELLVYIPSSIMVTPQITEEALQRFYRMEAERYLRSRTEHFAKRLNLHPTKIIVKTQKARWGSCDRHGVIRYNWQIICTPVEIIDYLVVHELCHLKYKHHQSSFWKLVATEISNYAYLKRELKLYRDCW